MTISFHLSALICLYTKCDHSASGSAFWCWVIMNFQEFIIVNSHIIVVLTTTLVEVSGGTAVHLLLLRCMFGKGSNKVYPYS